MRPFLFGRSSPVLDRRKRAQSLGKTNPHNTRTNEEDFYSTYGGRPTRKDTWQEKKVPSPRSWTVEVDEYSKQNMLPMRRATNSPPVPALLNKVQHYLNCFWKAEVKKGVSLTR